MNTENHDDGLSIGSILFGICGLFVGLVAGFFLFFFSYPWMGPAGIHVWKISLIDGTIIAGVGFAAFHFRKRSAFIRGILISTALLFIVNGLCGINSR